MTQSLNDPRKMFYNKDYPSQEQSTPALQSQMNPVPDTGEETYRGSSKLKNRHALVTGGDSGIGRAAAIAFAKEGADVAIQYFPKDEKDAQDVKKIIEKEGQRALLLPYDFKEEGNATEMVEKVVEIFGALDVLVLNAAQQIAHDSLEKLSMKQINDSFKVNNISQFEAIKAAEKHLKPGSSLVMTTSVQAFNPSPHLMDYAATKSVIANMVVNLSQYFADKGVRVNGVAPGPIWTPLQLDNGQLEGALPKFGQNSLLGRAGQPVELAPVYVLLASDDGSYITGQIFGVTGGENINL